jgi:hypothetical protein
LPCIWKGGWQPRLGTQVTQDYDPFVRERLEQERAASAADYIALTRERDCLVRAMYHVLAVIDVVTADVRRSLIGGALS